MAIRKVDGRVFLDSGTAIVAGNSVVELMVDHAGRPHEVALKFRSTIVPGTPDLRYGNPRTNRTVVQFLNYAVGETHVADAVPIGKIGEDELKLSFVLQSFHADPRNVWWVSYTLYAGAF